MTCWVMVSRSPAHALTTKASTACHAGSALRRPLSNANCAGAWAWLFRATMGLRHDRRLAVRTYTVAMAVCVKLAAWADHEGAKLWVSLAASHGGHANTKGCSSQGLRSSTRCWVCTTAPWAVNQAWAASGIKRPKSTLGSNISLLPLPDHSASLSTVRKTCPLACSAGRFKAETHSGSISSCMTFGVRPWHSCATVICTSHTKPWVCQPVDWRSKLTLSDQDQALAMQTPIKRFRGAGKEGKDSP